MNLLSQLDLDLLHINRAINDLRLGVPVIIDKNHLILATETVTQEIFEQIRSKIGQMFFAVPSCKALFPKDSGSNLVFYDVSDCSFEEYEDISDRHPLYDLFDQKSLYSAFKLIKLTGLLPTFLICNIKSNHVIDGDVSKINSQTIEQYYSHICNDWQFVADADLKLKHALNAKILAFRSKFVSHEHYAIVVGDITKVKSPYVRIHSSCYTGDLMASLSCDCRDQLTESIEYMGSDESKSGIILYLMQEGRGIGLTNKIRTYKLQQQGYDTVEANHYLGFEEDERVFNAAFSMLKHFGINSIKLLTNNPKKEDCFLGTGIKVEEVVSILGDVNNYNQSYLSTKKKKMGHRF